MNAQSTLIIFAIVVGLGLIGVVAVNIILTSEEAEARGCKTSTAVNASKGRCFNPGPN